MSPERQQIIFDRYPGIFRDRAKPMTETCICWGLQCGDGWTAIIDALCAAVDKPYEGSCGTLADGSDEGFTYTFPQVICTSLKEKFGTLRFYYHLEPDAAFEEQAKRFPKTAETLMARFAAYVDGAVGLAETLSARTCEDTGKPGELMVCGGWWRTVCSEVAAEKGFVKPEACP